MSRPIRLREMSRTDRTPLIHLETEDLMPLPVPLESPEKDHPWVPVSEQCKAKYECGLDDTCAVNIPKPKTPEEEKQLVARFLSGLDKLFSKENNWMFLQPLLLTMEHCTGCQTCADSCHVFEASGKNSSAAPSCRIAVRNCLLDSLVGVNFPQHIIVAGHPDIKGRHQENANHQVGDQAADNDNRKWPLGIRTDGMR